jgi:hypothetical protein
MFVDIFMCHLIYSGNENNKPDNSCVYLCVKEDDVFKCVKYNSFQEAEKNNNNIIIPVCRFLPVYFHKYILHYKLYNMFVKVKL